jgi:hypothetical protein
MLVFRGFIPNVAVERLARLLHIWMVPVAALRPVTGHTEIVRGFTQFPEENTRDYLKLCHSRLLPYCHVTLGVQGGRPARKADLIAICEPIV